MPTSVVANIDRQIHALTSALVSRMRRSRRGQAHRKRKFQIICAEQIDVSARVVSNAALILGCNSRGSDAAGLASRHLTGIAASYILGSQPHIAAERGVDLAGNLLVDLGEDAEPDEENPREVKRIIDDLARGVLRGEFKTTGAIQSGWNATSWRALTVKAALTSG